MGHFEIDVLVRRPIGEVFGYLSDVENTPHWYSAVQSAHLVQGPGPSLNAEYRIVRSLPQGTAADIVRVTEFQPPAIFRFGTADGPTPFDYRYTLESHGDNTLVRLDAQITLSGAAKLLAPVATQAFKRGMQDNLASLSARLVGSQ